MTTMIKITCATCGKQSEKKLAEITRQKKKGKTKFYCNLKCAGKNINNLTHISKFHNNFIDTKYIRQPDDKTNFRWYIKGVIRNSKKRNQHYDVDLAYLKELWEKQKGICPFTKKELVLRTHSYKENGGPYQASLDRIDNSKGYVKGNVRFVALIFNYAKNSFADETVIEFCRMVSKVNKNVSID